MSTIKDRVIGAVVGSAAADALGVHYETGIPSHGHAEMLGGGYGFEPCEWSDDTQQAVCVLMARSEVGAFADNLLAWYRSNPPDVGPTASRVLGAMSRNPVNAASAMAHAARQVKGKRGRGDGDISNGSLMRNGPVCLPFVGKDRNALALRARELSDLTHFDPYAGDACVLWSLMVEEAVRLGLPSFKLHDAATMAVAYLPEDRQAFWEQVIRGAHTDARPPRDNLNVIHAFHCALWSVAHAESYEDGVQRAIAIGGDTDTVAAIAGSLLGAMFGCGSIPADWRRNLHGSPGTKRIADLTALALEAAGIS